MARKKVRNGKNGIHVVLVLSIIILNIIGISYADWNGSMGILNSVLTGNIGPSFCDDYEVDNIKGNGDIAVSFDDEQTISIQGEVEPGFKAFLDYRIINNGSIPAKLVEKNITDDTGGLKLKVNQTSGVLEPQEYDYGAEDKGKLQIKANEEGMYDFEIELVYRQWEP